MQVLTRTLVRSFNSDLIRREIKQTFPTKFTRSDGLQLGGYVVDKDAFTTNSVVKGRIEEPAAEPQTVKDGTEGREVYQPGELRAAFDPALSAAQVTEFDNLLTNHVETNTTPEQNSEDKDQETLDEIKAFDDGDPWNQRTNTEQNQHIKNLNRVVLRLGDRLLPGE